MPNYTANFELPYPNSDDDPCLFAEQWCDFSEAFQTVLDGFQATIDRTVPTIPMAGFRRTVAKTFPGFGVIDYDAVNFDTAGWITFDVSAQAIVVDRAGVFTASGNTHQAPDGTNIPHSLYTTFTYVNKILDRGIAGQTIGNWTTGDGSITSALNFSNTMILSSASSVITINSAYFALLWHADTVRAS